MKEARLRGRHGALLALDIGICVVILGFAVSFLVVHSELHRFDADAVSIADWAASRGINRIGWPEDRREAVRSILNADVTPVLMAAPVPPAQQLAVNNTPVVVTTDPEYLKSLSRNELKSGPFTAREIDLDAARRVPIADGESLGEQISRPYLYAPFRDSRKVPAAQPWHTPLTLSAGHYVLSVAAFDPGFKTSATLSAALGPRQLATTTARLQVVVIAPMRIEFDVLDANPVVVQVKLVVTGPFGSAAVVHEWEIRRQDRRT